ncbi:gap junction delta-4 [Pelobates cultripes]|uniref:Gap junction protein n=1 Tax=Pelobates cultripes TaxID=61616 RepID=A0AAD1RV83_PELCU|nr:gap junction delta-4 [Pelobates cultripes]
MNYLDSMGFLIITFNYNVTPIGKIWLTIMVLLRMAMAVFAGYPLYQDEQERFVCNTLQPGCANVCYDIFSPVSYMRYWLIQTVIVFLPYALFCVHVLNKATKHMTVTNDHYRKDDPPCYHSVGLHMEIPDFSLAYTIHLLLRTSIEAGFCAGQYFLYGILVPKRFSCSQSPCTSSVDCYISRPTEKSLVMIFIWATSAVSLVLGMLDLIQVIHRKRQSETFRRQLLLLENDSMKGGCCSNTPPNAKLSETPEQMISYSDCPSNNLSRKISVHAKGDSHSLPSCEGETASFQTDNSNQEMGKSNMNTNSNKACPWQVSITPPSGSANTSEHHTIIQRQLHCKKEHSSDPSLLNSTQSESNTTSKPTKSEWV